MWNIFKAWNLQKAFLTLLNTTNQAKTGLLETEGGIIANQPFGCMYQDDNVTETAISVIDQWEHILNFSDGTCSNGITFNANTLVPAMGGTYQILWSATMENGKDKTFEMGIIVNDAIQSGTKAKIISHVADAPYELSSSSPFLALTANDIIKLKIRNRDSIDNVTITHATVTIQKVA